MTYRVFNVFCLLALGLSSANVARADRVAVIVPPPADQMVSNEVVDTATEELARLLRAGSFNVIGAAQAAATAETQGKGGAFSGKYDPLFCVTPDCAEEYRKLLDALLAVQLKIVGKSGRAASVEIVITEGPGASYKANALVQGNDVRTGVREAFDEARGKQHLGAGPWLTVLGSPDGATIYVDNAESGRIPLQKRRIGPGEHTLEVRSDGYLSFVRKFLMPGEIDKHETMRVDLDRQQAPRATYDPKVPRRIVRSGWDWAVGSAFVAVGAAHLIAGAIQKRKEGDCAERDGNNACTEVYGSGSGVSRSNMMIGFGAAGVALGGLVMSLGPFGALGVHANAEHTMLEWKGKF